MKRNTLKQSPSDKRRILRPRLEVKEEEGFDKSDVKKALLESLYEQHKEERRKNLEADVKRGKVNKREFVEGDEEGFEGTVHASSQWEEEQVKFFKVKYKDKVKVRDLAAKTREVSREKVANREVKYGEEVRDYPSVNDKEATQDRDKTKHLEMVDCQKEKGKEHPVKTKVNTEKLKSKEVWRNLDIDSLPSTADFIRFVSLDYSRDPDDLPRELQQFHTLPLAAISQPSCSISNK